MYSTILIQKKASYWASQDLDYSDDGSPQGKVTTVTTPTTIYIPGNSELTTATVPTPAILPGELVTQMIPGAGEIITATDPITVQIPPRVDYDYRSEDYNNPG